jgi:hypothetical protein
MSYAFNYFRRRYSSILNSQPIDTTYDEFMSLYNSFYNDYKEIIDNYDNNKINIEKKDYLNSPHFTLHIIKNRNTTDSIIAQVKWKYSIDNKIKKLKFHSIFIGTTNQIGSNVETETVKTTAKEKIIEYFNEKSPELTVDFDLLNKNIAVAELFNLLRSKKDEITARLNPVFYLSKVANKSSYKSIVANIKWGHPYPGRNVNPRYVSYYIGSENDIKDDITSEKFKEKIKSDIVDYLKVNSYTKNNL